MKRLNFILSIFFLSLVIGIISCNDTDKNSTDQSKRILSAPPFNTITDSIERFPKEPWLYLERAVRLSQANRHELATSDYRTAWELSGDEGIAMEYAANLFLVNKIRDAVKLLEEGQKKFPENTEFSRRLGEMYAELGEKDLALKQYDNILSTDSSNFETWYDKSSLLLQMNDTAGAIAALEKSFQIVPAYFSGLDLAHLYAFTGNARALEICDFLLQNDTTPQGARAYVAKGIYYTNVKKPKEALSEFETAIQRDWKNTDAYIEAGIIHFELKDYQKALKTFNLAATVSNTDPDTYFWMARCHEALGNIEEAIQNYERAIALDRSMYEARNRLNKLRNS